MLSPLRTAAAAALAGLAAGALAPAWAQDAREPALFQGRAFVFRVDLEAGRRLGWLDPELADDDALAAVARTLNERLRGAGRFVEATVQLEPDAHLSVTFVGDQAPGIEAFLVAGLADPGRLIGRFEPGPDDWARLGSTRAAEEERLAAWRELHPEAALAELNALAPAQGGPAAGLFWAALRAPAEEDAEALLLLDEPEWVFTRGQMERGLRPAPDAPEPYGLGFRMLAEPFEELGRTLHRNAARAFVLTLNDRVVARPASPPAETFRLGNGYAPEEVRALIFAVAGEPLQAPLTFVERTTRPLGNVKQR